MKGGDTDELMTIGEAAKWCPLTEGQLRGRISSGALPAVRLAGNIFIRKDDLIAFLKLNDHD
jgi:helix-turn-helix protein